MAEKTYSQEKLDAAVQKAEDKARKNFAKEVQGLIKDEIAIAKELESKEAKQAVTNALKSLSGSIKDLG